VWRCLSVALLSAPAWAADPRLAIVSAPPAADAASRVLVVAGDEDVRARLATGAVDAVRADSPAGDASTRRVSPLGNAPVRTVIAVDQSGSFKAHWDEAFDLSLAFADASGANVSTEVVTFGAALSSHGVATDAASLRTLLDTAKKQGAIQGYTRLRNFILEAVELADAANPAASGGLRQVVVFTDAGEESTAYPVDEVVRRAREHGVAVHMVVWAPRGPTSARRLDEVKQIAERTGGSFLQADDPAAVKAGLARVAKIADRAFWIDLAWCGVPAGQERIDTTVEIEAWNPGARLATTGAWPFRQHASAASQTSCTPAPDPAPPPEAAAPAPARKTPWWWWLAIPLGLLPLLLLLLLLLRRRREPEPAPPPPAPPPAPAEPVKPAMTASSAFPPVREGDDPLERLPVVVLEKVRGPTEAPQQLRLHKRVIRVGAAPECELRIPVPQISSQHATVQLFPNGNVFVRDDGSTNGTWLGERKIGAQERERVGDGQILSFSRQVQYRLVRPGAAPVVAPPPPEPAPPPPKNRTILAPARPLDDPPDGDRG
jgi:hypothetical protein